MKKLTPVIVKDFWKYMHKKYGTSVVNKGNSKEMKLIDAVLSIIGVMDKGDFLDKFTTTIGHKIYVPFTIGDDTMVSLESQVATCVHEHVHVRQFKETGFAWEYLMDSSKRAVFECEAYRATMEMWFYLKSDYPTPKSISDSLKAYNCTAKDRAFAKKYLQKTSAIVRRGGVVTAESKTAKKWLEKRTSEETRMVKSIMRGIKSIKKVSPKKRG